MERTAELPAAHERADPPVDDDVDDAAAVRAPDRLRAGAPSPPAGSALVLIRRPPPAMSYLPSLDGLRAVAVTAVLIYHAGIGWLPGGFLGVEVFFVISGYLITCLLLAERRATGSVSLRRFWARRARRLLPALFLVLVVTSAWWLLFLRSESGPLRGDVVAALTYVTNWWLVLSRQSYFAQAGRPSPLRHLWSLAVEEQFYLVWPLLFAVLVAVTGGVRRKAAKVLVAAAALSSLVMFLLFDPASDPSRAYYGTDTRASGLLLGAALAFVLPPWRLSRRTGPGAPVVIDAVGLLTLAGLGWFFLRVNEFDPFIYRRGFLLLDLLTVVVIVVVIHPAGTVIRWSLSRRPVVWIGRRSYGIYLWHWPVFVLTRPGLDIALTGRPLLALRLAVTAGLAAASYRFVEQPVRAGALGRIPGRLHAMRHDARPATRARAVLSLSAVVVVGAVVIGLATTPSGRVEPPAGFEQVSTDGTIPPPTAPGATAPAATAPATAAPSTGPAPPTTGPSPARPRPAPNRTGPSSTVAPAPPAAVGRSAPMVPPSVPPAGAPVAPLLGADASAIGDSVMAGARSALKERMPGLYLNAAVGRQWSEAPGIATALAQAGYLRPVVVLNLGTNGVVTGPVLDKLFAELTANRVLLVNTCVDRPWAALVNRRLAEAVTARPNAVLVDWASTCRGRPEFFVADGVHLTVAGARAYADVIARSLH